MSSRRWVAAVAVLVPALGSVAIPLALVGGGAAYLASTAGSACAADLTPVAVAAVSAPRAVGRFSSEQRSIAATAVRVADERRLPERAKITILATGLVESGVRNLPYGDLDSLGWLQQRASWGSRAERMNVATAAGKFYDHLVRVPNWQTRPVGQVAQTVQVSGFPDRYQTRVAEAQQLLGLAPAAQTTPADCGGLGATPDLVAELNPSGAGNWQGAIKAGAYWYVAHAYAGDRAQIFHRLTAAGVEIDSMTAVGFAHATSFGVVGNTVYASAGNYDVVSFPYTPGRTITRRDTRPTGWRGYISIDPSGRTVVIRNGNQYQAYDAATRKPIGVRISTPTGPRQGFSINGATVYVLTGPTNQPARVDAYSVATGQHTGTQDVTGVGYQAGEHGTHREPEGMFGNLMGVKVFTGTQRRLRVFRLSSSPTVGGYRTVSGVRIPIPQGPAGVAINYALSQVGKPYVWAAHGPNAFDCSGLTGQAWIHAGVTIPQQSDAQNRALRHVPVSQARPGDILWQPGHVQIFLGAVDGKWTVVEAANPRAGIRVDQTHWMHVTAVLRPA